MPTLEITATELTGVRVNKVSLVKRGANRLPFRVLKGDDAMPLDLGSFFRKSDTEAEASAAQTAELQKSLDAAKALLEANGHSVAKAEAPKQDAEKSESKTEDEKVEDEKKAGPKDEEKSKSKDDDAEKDVKKDDTGNEKPADEAKDVAKTDASDAAAIAAALQKMEELMKTSLEAVTTQVAAVQDTISDLADRVAKNEEAVSKQDKALQGLVPGRAAEDPNPTRTRKSEPGLLPPIDTAFGRV